MNKDSRVFQKKRSKTIFSGASELDMTSTLERVHQHAILDGLDG